MGLVTVPLRVRLVTPEARLDFDFAVEPGQTLAGVLSRIHLDCHLPGMPCDWQFSRADEPVPADAEAGSLAGGPGTVELTLRRVAGSGVVTPSSRAPADASGPDRATPQPFSLLEPETWGPADGNGEDANEEELDAIREQKLRYSSSKLRVLPPGERRGVVRYCARMTPHKTFPVVVVLSGAQTKAMRTQAGPGAGEIEIEPVLPGCACYPTRATIPLSDGPAAASFAVVPHVLGRVLEARLTVRQAGRVVAEVPLNATVRRPAPTLPLLLAGLALLAPTLISWLAALETVEVYPWAGRWPVAVPLVGLGVASLAAAAVGHFRTAPRQTDVLWELTGAPG